ncbi:hypothetical protein ASG87_04435 [Frateuria sp. Soil773]|uniref:alpha/beta fold hydrolase n=1 Tax=Frateuria sp. Soil773 TaxID=1736407 RepID=UPI000701CE61|nr:hypothetical protein [Frateuria sp. Soil773]KRE89579.1 hypothetical protein ASG87_04435 [Frateuria sp. Soil773]
MPPRRNGCRQASPRWTATGRCRWHCSRQPSRWASHVSWAPAPTPPPGFDAAADLWRADACKPGYVTAVSREQDGRAQSLVEASRAGGLGDLPLLVFSRDPGQPRPPALPTSDWQQANAAHDAAQETLAHLSTRGRRIVARGSGHYIHFERPELLVSEIGAFVAAIRRGSAEPGQGSTVAE